MNFDVNRSFTPGNMFPGAFFLNIKDLLVADGWTVRGSGDGLTRHGDIDASITVPTAEQGSGGLYDCWKIGNTTDGIAGGAGNSDGWCWLRSPNGTRDLILAGDPQAFPVNHLGRVGATREDSGGFVGGSTSSTALPTVTPADEEFWMVGTRTTGGYLYAAGLASDDIVYTSFAYEGDEFLWFTYYFDNSLSSYAVDTNEGWVGIVSVEVPNPSDPDPWYYLRTSVATNPVGYWDFDDAVWITSTSNIGDLGAINHQTSLLLAFPYIDSSTLMAKGVANREFILVSETVRAFGARMTEDGTGFVYVQHRPGASYSLFSIWPDTSTNITGGTPLDDAVWDPFPANSTGIPPTVTLVSPPTTKKISRKEIHTFQITDLDGLAAIWISVLFASTGLEEVAFRDGQANPLYNITQTPIANGFQITVQRKTGWPSNPTIVWGAVDSMGTAI